MCVRESFLATRDFSETCGYACSGRLYRGHLKLRAPVSWRHRDCGQRSGESRAGIALPRFAVLPSKSGHRDPLSNSRKMSAACCEACSETTSFGVRKPSPSRATSTGMAKREDFLAYVTVLDHPAIGSLNRPKARIHAFALPLVLFRDPGGRPLFFTGASFAASIHAGGRPRLFPAPIAILSRLRIASSTCTSSWRSSASTFPISMTPSCQSRLAFAITERPVPPVFSRETSGTVFSFTKIKGK
jgi:hypothetical protein